MNYGTAARQGKWRIDYAESDPAVIAEYVRLTEDLFGVSPSVRNRKRWYEAYYCSKIIYRFYSRVLEHKTGKKTGTLKIPDPFRHDSRSLFGFLRGLFTAEGSIKVESNIRIALEIQESLLIRQTASIMRKATFHPHLYSYAREGRKVYGLYIYGLDETSLFHRMIGFVGRKRLRLSKVINQFERRGAQPGKARWRSKTPPSVAVKHSNGARPKRPLDGSGSRFKEKKPADGRHQARLRISPGLPKQPCSLAQRWFLIRAINAHDPRLSGVSENSQSGTSFLESGTSLEDAIKPHASGPPHRRQQVKSSAAESSCAPPEM
jgi:hypothetical protein